MDNYAQIYTALPSGRAHNDMKFRIAATKKYEEQVEAMFRGKRSEK